MDRQTTEVTIWGASGDPGVTGANVATAQAYIADVTEEEERTVLRLHPRLAG